MTANKRRHHISRHGSALAAAATAAAGVLVCPCCYRCNIHSCLKSLTLASEQLAAHQHNTSQLVNVSVCSMRGHGLEGVLIQRVLTGTEFPLKHRNTAHPFMCFYLLWCFIHPFYELKMCFCIFFPPCVSLTLQQLMRERQQMASRPFASVAVALDVGSDREELLQVRTRHRHATIHADSNNSFF